MNGGLNLLARHSRHRGERPPAAEKRAVEAADTRNEAGLVRLMRVAAGGASRFDSLARQSFTSGSGCR
jgi:hypothetical protein